MSDQLRTLSAEAGDEDPLAALRAVRGIRVELDRHEAALVRRARNAGMGWQMIASALGVSRQAVHKKYGRS
jgi:DNA invertase Pin-like site-specific DNA recombinase